MLLPVTTLLWFCACWLLQGSFQDIFPNVRLITPYSALWVWCHELVITQPHSMIRQALLLVALINSLPTTVSRSIDVHDKAIGHAELGPVESVKFSLSDITVSTNFIIFQVHAHRKHVTLSLTPDFIGSTTVGSNVGVMTKLQPGQKEVTWYAKVNSTDSAAFNVFFLASSHGYYEPLPGACNMEFPLENDPNVLVDIVDYQNVVKYQYGNMRTSRDSLHQYSCDSKTVQQALHYELYQSYLPSRDQGEDAYFTALKNMLNPDWIKSNGTKMGSMQYLDQTLLSFTSLDSQGVVYNAIITYSGRSVAYVPVATYSCQNEEMHCNTLGVVAMVMAVILGLIGLFLCLLGHWFFKFEIFVFGYLAFQIIFSIVLIRFTGLDINGALLAALPLGLVGGVLCFTLWFFKGIPVVSVLLVSLVCGYLLQCIVFSIPAFGNLSWWKSSFNYHIASSCSTLIIPVILLAFTKPLNIISCASVGSYLVVFAADTFLEGSVRQLLITSVRKASVPSYLGVTITGTHGTSDIVLLVVWFVLAFGGVAFQFWRERNHPPFPRCPWDIRQHKLQARASFTRPQEYDEVTNEEDNERRPLLGNRGHQSLPSNPQQQQQRQQRWYKTQEEADTIRQLQENRRRNHSPQIVEPI